MAVKIAINGFGRIGRLAFREIFDSAEFDVVALNDLTDAETLAYLLKYDTAQGNYKIDSVEATENGIKVDGKEIKIYAEKDANNLPWGDLDVDVVLECTGFYTSKEKAEAHINAGAKKVVISAPAKGDLKTVVYNVNDEILDGSEKIISGASCTTNCLAPVAKVLDDNFGLVKGFMTTIHAYTNAQNTLDAPHPKGINSRRGRAAAANILPTSTGAAVAVGKVLPELNGKLDGIAVRVPTVTGSLVDLVVELEKEVTAEDINNAMKEAANETLGYTEDPIVSSDIIGTKYGSLFDGLSTRVMTDENGKQIVKLLTWYDNEMSYTAQLIRTCKDFATMG
ncbi:glyceraldehyde-3-phosphate dehydrogenase (NAD+) [Orenia metallireducens]|jgi:glyceraldehyde 3-phosphate dehydrogenase|uniref:Glyceraldehyde-3-phosphate dehydrogenase n=1 Tax=Orenia metallireducens TaxID=1413210 RepID=A0A285H8S7_9FIRM|nr:type I glyceraldehyde-3-phosphate dehydrogenase [Orenia metallireducens]PRX28645.1 glyceraldehyde-3-phosphate dehydrogenase (NAD+) [Orenia metallireducens]SNY31021.1 glyceraldehyde-3-phosphate dehydrogenase (NAD+) [Orenia metallireducens]